MVIKKRKGRLLAPVDQKGSEEIRRAVRAFVNPYAGVGFR
jgi:hypothetical protein